MHVRGRGVATSRAGRKKRNGRHDAGIGGADGVVHCNFAAPEVERSIGKAAVGEEVRKAEVTERAVTFGAVNRAGSKDVQVDAPYTMAGAFLIPDSAVRAGGEDVTGAHIDGSRRGKLAAESSEEMDGKREGVGGGAAETIEVSRAVGKGGEDEGRTGKGVGQDEEVKGTIGKERDRRVLRWLKYGGNGGLKKKWKLRSGLRETDHTPVKDAGGEGIGEATIAPGDGE